MLAIVADTVATKTGQLKFHLMKYCADNGLNQMDIEEDKDMQSDNLRALLVTYFDNKEQSKTFCDGFTKQNAAFLNDIEADIKIMPVSEENLRRIKYTIINVYYLANLALIAFEASSYPGLSKRANIFFL